MAVISSGHFAYALYPGVSKWYQGSYDEFTPQYPEIFTYNKSKRAYEEEVGQTGFGLAPVKNEGQGITYDTQVQGYMKRYTHVTYGIGFVITREMYEDDLYDVAARRRAQGLAFSMRQTKETIAANVLNRAFTAAYTGGDGVELCATTHPNKSGGTWKNELTTAADLSEAALEQARIDIADFQTDRGLKINYKPVGLVIPPELEFEACRILKSVLQNDTANNATNALKSLGTIPKVIVNNYLTDTDAWFIKTGCPDGMKWYERRADEFGMDNDFDTELAKFKATARFSFGWTDPRGIFGSPGA